VVQITPRRLDFVKEKEKELFTTLNDLASNKQNELLRIISETKESVVPILLDKAEDYMFLSVDVPASGLVSSSKQVHLCVREMQDLVMGNLSTAIESQLVASISVLRDSFTGVLQRCLEHLEGSSCEGESSETGSPSQALNEVLR
jgi:receptor-interacting serine/threonine-protein kinase 5